MIKLIQFTMQDVIISDIQLFCVGSTTKGFAYFRLQIALLANTISITVFPV